MINGIAIPIQSTKKTNTVPWIKMPSTIKEKGLNSSYQVVKSRLLVKLMPHQRLIMMVLQVPMM